MGGGSLGDRPDVLAGGVGYGLVGREFAISEGVLGGEFRRNFGGLLLHVGRLDLEQPPSGTGGQPSQFVR